MSALIGNSLQHFKKMKKLYLIPIATVIIFIFYLHCQDDVYKENINDILRLEKVDIKNESSAGIYTIRDACAIYVYKLSDETVKEFISKYPQNIKFRIFDEDIKWTSAGWHQAPLDSFYIPVYEKTIASDYLGENRYNLKLEKMRKILLNDSSYYAMYYQSFPCQKGEGCVYFVGFVRFFLLDTVNNELYILET